MDVAKIIKAYEILNSHGLDVSSILEDGFVSISTERERKIVTIGEYGNPKQT